jgi:hypothetical protein
MTSKFLWKNENMLRDIGRIPATTSLNGTLSDIPPHFHLLTFTFHLVSNDAPVIHPKRIFFPAKKDPDSRKPWIASPEKLVSNWLL